MRPPTNVTQLRSFLGLCNVYRRFVSNFTRIAAPLTNKHRNNNRHTFLYMTEAEIKSFRRLKDILVKPPVLTLPRSDLAYVFHTDACDQQLGAFLMQRYENKVLKPICYYSPTITAAERNYDTTEPECLSIVWAILLLGAYLYGTPFEVCSDYDSLRWLLNIETRSGRLARWKLRLREFDYEFRVHLSTWH